jgi:HTH-type transcriptional regulator/antitoxin HigA
MQRRFEDLSMDIKPVRTQRDYKAALGEVERLFDAEPGTADADRLEVLTTLVEAYEERNHPIAPPDPIDAIAYFMESRGLSRKDLEPFLGSRAKVSEILNRRRPLSIEMIRRLNQGLGIPAEVLIQPYDLEVA